MAKETNKTSWYYAQIAYVLGVQTIGNRFFYFNSQKAAEAFRNNFEKYYERVGSMEFIKIGKCEIKRNELIPVDAIDDLFYSLNIEDE